MERKWFILGLCLFWAIGYTTLIASLDSPRHEFPCSIIILIYSGIAFSLLFPFFYKKAIKYHYDASRFFIGIALVLLSIGVASPFIAITCIVVYGLPTLGIGNLTILEYWLQCSVYLTLGIILVALPVEILIGFVFAICAKKPDLYIPVE